MQSKTIYFSLLMNFVVTTITCCKEDVRNSKSYINFADIVKGGELVFEIGNSPSKIFGVDPSHKP